MRSCDTANLWSEPSTSFSRQPCGRFFRSSSLHVGPSRCACLRTQQQLCHRSLDTRYSERKRGHAALCRAEEGKASGTESQDTATRLSQDDQIKQTLADLDALLGIQEQEEAKKAKEAEKEKETQNGQKGKMDLTISREVLDSISKAEAERITKGKGDSVRESKEEELSEKMEKILENARKMSETSRPESQADMERDLRTLFGALVPDNAVSKKHQARIKDKVFGPTSFYVTDIKPLSLLRTVNLNSPSASNQELIQSSILVRGNLRAPREEVFEKICANLTQEFGNEYTAIMVTDPMSEDEDPRGGPRVAFQIASSSMIQPQDSRNWQRILALVLGGLTLATAIQLGLTANISKLPKEVVDFIVQPDNLKGDVPPEVENFDALPLFLAALPISVSVIGIQAVHEIAHRIVAATRKMKLGAPIFLPNAQLGCFGAITQLKSMARNRTDLFDVAAAGPAAGAIASAVLFTAGLIFSTSAPPEELLPVPGALVNGSLLLGSLTHLVLGDAANSTTISIHPFLIAGWCGMVSTALNCLPVGTLDGGRLMMAAFGRNLLGVTSFFTYLGLGLGFLGSGLALPFGIFVLLCQREPEKYLQDTVTAPSENRQTLAAVIIAAAVLVLLPMLPGSTDLGAGGGFGI